MIIERTMTVAFSPSNDDDDDDDGNSNNEPIKANMVVARLATLRVTTMVMPTNKDNMGKHQQPHKQANNGRVTAYHKANQAMEQ